MLSEPAPETEESFLSGTSHGDSSRAADDEVAALTGVAGEDEDSGTSSELNQDTPPGAEDSSVVSDRKTDTTLIGDAPNEVGVEEAGADSTPVPDTIGSIEDLAPIETSTPAPDTKDESAKEAMDRDEEKDMSVRTTSTGSPGVDVCKASDSLKGSAERLSNTSSDDSQDTVLRSDLDSTNMEDNYVEAAATTETKNSDDNINIPVKSQEASGAGDVVEEANDNAYSEISSVLPEPAGLDSTMESMSDLGTADGVEDIDTDSELYDTYPPDNRNAPFPHGSVVGRDIGQAINLANMQFHRMDQPTKGVDRETDMPLIHTKTDSGYQDAVPPPHVVAGKPDTKDDGEVIIDVLEMGMSDSDDSERLLYGGDSRRQTDRSFGNVSTDSSNTDQLVHCDVSGQGRHHHTESPRNESGPDNSSMYSQNKSDSGAYFSDDYRPVQPVRPHNYYQERYGQPRKEKYENQNSPAHMYQTRKPQYTEANKQVTEDGTHININPPPHININPKNEAPPPQPASPHPVPSITFTVEEDVYDEDLRAMRAFLDERVVPKMEFSAKSIDLAMLAESPYSSHKRERNEGSHGSDSQVSEDITLDQEEDSSDGDSQCQEMAPNPRDGVATPQTDKVSVFNFRYVSAMHDISNEELLLYNNTIFLFGMLQK